MGGISRLRVDSRIPSSLPHIYNASKSRLMNKGSRKTIKTLCFAVLGMFGVVRGDSGWFRFFGNIPLKFNYKNRIFINCYCWKAKIVTINYSPKTFFNWLPRSNLRDPPINEKSIAEKSINFTKIEIKKVSRGFQWKSFYCSSLTPTPNY